MQCVRGVFLVALSLQVLTACGESEASNRVEGRTLPEKIVTPLRRPRPLEGGGLTTYNGGETLIATDPDRDKVWLIDVASSRVEASIQLPDFAEPTKVEVDGEVIIVLEAGRGEIVRLAKQGETWDVALTRSVCSDAKDIAIDAAAGYVLVSCESGSVVKLSLDTGTVVETVELTPGLSDIAIDGEDWYISKLRTAEVLVVRNGVVAETLRPTTPEGVEPAVGWRMINHPEGGVLLTHQLARSGTSVEVTDKKTGYAGFGKCKVSISPIGVSHLVAGEEAKGGHPIGNVVLPLDIAVAPDGFDYRFAVAGGGHRNTVEDLNPAVVVDTQATMLGLGRDFSDAVCAARGERGNDGRQITSVTFVDGDRLAYLSRDPWQIVIEGQAAIELPGTDARDTGFDLFHEDTGGGIACASCHPHALDDAQTWFFEGLGERRTPAISGGVSGTAPFHWSGDMEDFTVLMREVFATRMGGPVLSQDYAEAIEGWLDTVPAPLPVVEQDVAKVEMGRSIFESAEAQCVTCHSGEANLTFDVGTGEPFQVPRLTGLAQRAPYMHDGCADTLMDRFTNTECGGGELHGRTAHLSTEQLDALVTYLMTL